MAQFDRAYATSINLPLSVQLYHVGLPFMRYMTLKNLDHEIHVRSHLRIYARLLKYTDPVLSFCC